MNIIKTEKGYYYKIYKNNTNNHNTKIKKLQLWCNKSKNNWGESY